ncbi:MAG: epimerase [Chloroflexi bacterium RBG_16_57_11]|nr:MAG: epimerase [Chloroflexi bacterium RBG_16_57_11]
MDAVIGAFGYTGKYITRLLLAQGRQVITLTGHPHRPNEFGGQVKALPFDSDHPDQLANSLEGVDTLYNTYWVRFDHGTTTFSGAVRNTQALFRAAKQAGVRRIVHTSITNPSLDSPLPYFRGKAQLEKDLQELGVPYAILRPTVLFGQEDILINNIAYLVRKFPFFAIPGDGEYPMQPIFVEDYARLAVQISSGKEDCTLDAVGPDIFSFNQLVELIASSLGRRLWLAHLPPSIALQLSRIIGWWMKDVTLTWDEYRGLSAGMLISSQPPTGRTRLADWLAANASQVGSRYASELERHYR